MKDIIKGLRMSMGLSRLAFSRLLNASHTSIANWEKGLSEPISIMKDKIMGLKKRVEKQRDSN